MELRITNLLASYRQKLANSELSQHLKNQKEILFISHIINVFAESINQDVNNLKVINNYIKQEVL